MFKLTIALSNKYRVSTFVQTGRQVPAEVTLSIDPATLTAENRKMLADVLPLEGGRLTLPRGDGVSAPWQAPLLPDVSPDADPDSPDVNDLLFHYRIDRAKNQAAIDKAASEDREKRIAELDARIAWLEANRSPSMHSSANGEPSIPSRFSGLPRYSEACTLASEIRAAVKKHDAGLRAAEKARVEAAKAKAEADKAAHNAEKAAWIAAHGSEFLKRAVARGHDCQRRYVTERATAEFSGYVVDFDGNVSDKPRSCPSEEALTEAETVGDDAEVVWVAGMGGVDFSDDLPAQFEAVRISDYLGSYDLYRPYPDGDCSRYA